MLASANVMRGVVLALDDKRQGTDFATNVNEHSLIDTQAKKKKYVGEQPKYLQRFGS